MKCDEAFKLSKIGSNSCKEHVKVPCILCEHLIEINCEDKERYLELYSRGLFEDIISRGDINVVNESRFNHNIVEDSPIWDLIAQVKCKTKMNLQRTCNFYHFLELSCFDILNMFVKRIKSPPLCQDLVPIQLSCGHEVKVKCHQKDRPPLCKKPIFEEFKYPNCEHTCKPQNCGALQILKNDQNLKCPFEVDFNLYRCHHSVRVKCHDLSTFHQSQSGSCLPPNSNIVLASMIYCQPCVNAPECIAKVTFEFECGHQLQDISCTEAFNWSANYSQSPICNKLVPWISTLCQHELQIPCHQLPTFIDWEPWSNISHPKYEEITIDNNLQIKSILHYPDRKSVV